MPFRCISHATVFVLALSLVVLGTPGTSPAQTKAEVALGAADIGGRVSGPTGPEAGIWVIAETRDVPTKFAKIVVTDEDGRFVIPELPAASYKIWSRGYGLVDSEKQQPVDPSKDKWVKAAFYGISPDPRSDVILGQSMGPGFSRIDQPSLLVRLIPGDDPPHTAVSEIFQPPEGAFGSRGLDVDLIGMVWTVLSSGHLASFDRNKCKSPLKGPDAATGKQCFEGWTLYRFPGPQFKGVDPNGSADHAYYVWVDLYNTLGLGQNVPIASTNGGEQLLALVNGEFVRLRVPYPMGFFTKNVDGRIDDPNAGWKGRAVWTTSGTRANFHSEGGKGVLAKVFKFQMRPDPLAH